ncbi:hypothetical protein CCM_02333 [Cordyceps militaris CM01]|uniref:Uncharacterized protein n=1 Tax=Cordyceps militaris (strain CM01) TaxID=983644 RepID=G3J930_CORMM|nr:uncharacterized protein CCM_02333 [Cordyceps militaris CM01]EGX94062.1 hypothetical protein CCM_02333 [Cordyceps militaris CM01]
MRVPEGLSVLPARFQAPRNTQVSKLALLDQPRNKPFLPQVFVRRLEAFFEKSASLQEAWQIMHLPMEWQFLECHFDLAP